MPMSATSSINIMAPPHLTIPHPFNKELPFGLTKDGHRWSVPSFSVLDVEFFVVTIPCTDSLSAIPAGEVGKLHNWVPDEQLVS